MYSQLNFLLEFLSFKLLSSPTSTGCVFALVCANYSFFFFLLWLHNYPSMFISLFLILSSILKVYLHICIHFWPLLAFINQHLIIIV